MSSSLIEIYINEKDDSKIQKMNLSRLFLMQLFKPFENRRFFSTIKKPERYLYRNGFGKNEKLSISFSILLLRLVFLYLYRSNYWPFTKNTHQALLPT